MEIAEALKIVRALAEGVDPQRGEVLRAESVFQHPQTVRALQRAVGALEYVQEREQNQKKLPGNAGKPWSRNEDQQVCDEVRRGMSFHDIAKGHNRTVGSIVARLIKLGQIGPRASAPGAA